VQGFLKTETKKDEKTNITYYNTSIVVERLKILVKKAEKQEIEEKTQQKEEVEISINEDEIPF